MKGKWLEMRGTDPFTTDSGINPAPTAEKGITGKRIQ
jgi:hypothetical protein